jgi:carboxylesterase type B
VAPSQPARPWRGVPDATYSGPACPQLADDGTIIGSENCLSLSVTTPPAPAAAAFPSWYGSPAAGSCRVDTPLLPLHRFATTGNPNAPGLPYWPSYQADSPVLSLTSATNGIQPSSFAAAHHYAFLEHA